MKIYPLHDTAYSFSGDHLHINLLLDETGSLGIEIYSLGESKIHVEADRQPVSVQELKLALIGQDAQDLIASFRALFDLVDSGSN